MNQDTLEITSMPLLNSTKQNVTRFYSSDRMYHNVFLSQNYFLIIIVKKNSIHYILCKNTHFSQDIINKKQYTEHFGDLCQTKQLLKHPLIIILIRNCNCNS